MMTKISIDKSLVLGRISEIFVAIKLSPVEIGWEIGKAIKQMVDPDQDGFLSGLPDEDLFRILIHFERLDATMRARIAQIKSRT